MLMTKVKICGLRTPDDIGYVNQLKPDYAGFVFAPGKRQISLLLAIRMRVRLAPQIQAVGVFVNEPLETVAALCRQRIIDIVQLHGDEDASYISRLKEKTSAPIIRAVRVQNKDQILEAEQLPCDYLLLDTFVEGQYGGSGKQFDPSLIPEQLQKPYFLAGGLDEQNVCDILSRCRPFGVDVSSGVETDGCKDFDKISRFLAAVRQST
ncbi:phosphoribosylanthranilate isomerase [Lachnospiraceae bacterium ASD4241]|uniref:N-(5'-phosphoribosyl)anthranilate isomerase n=2 Tax=Diplocloster modestus TaxID=2850322 RepID=A0ABS6K2A7_9FIRM|nr:phosphoribosylanthranilate isomerase [Diplocloster modestus]MBU9724756.1 phosphoribosylanthranilate isomerase [Diplocloster modestus]